MMIPIIVKETDEQVGKPLNIHALKKNYIICKASMTACLFVGVLELAIFAFGTNDFFNDFSL